MKITKARVTESKGMFSELPAVYIKVEDGEEQKLFDFYPDELSFTAGEFIGLTVEEAHRLKLKKDVAYLQS